MNQHAILGAGWSYLQTTSRHNGKLKLNKALNTASSIQMKNDCKAGLCLYYHVARQYAECIDISSDISEDWKFPHNEAINKTAKQKYLIFIILNFLNCFFRRDPHDLHDLHDFFTPSSAFRIM